MAGAGSAAVHTDAPPATRPDARAKPLAPRHGALDFSGAMSVGGGVDKADLFARLMAEATVALEDAAGLAAELQAPPRSVPEARRRLRQARALAHNAAALLARGAHHLRG